MATLPTDVTSLRDALRIEKFNGVPEQWYDWSWILVGSLDTDQVLVDLMTQAAEEKTVIDFDLLPDDIQEKSRKLATELTKHCRDKALRIIQMVQPRRNGLEMWRQLTVEFGTPSSVSDQLLSKILNFQFKKGNDFMDQYNVWRQMVQQYDRNLPTGEQLSLAVQRSVVGITALYVLTDPIWRTKMFNHMPPGTKCF
jgi:hypothetical protein